MIPLRYRLLYWLAFAAAACWLARLGGDHGGAAKAVAAALFFFAWGWLACEYHVFGYGRKK